MDELLESPSLANRAYVRLRGEILHGDLMPGERLRAADLHDRFGLGLTPIREALMRLSTEGLVDAESRRGSRVIQASIDELADLMATRREIERLCLTRAIERGDTAWEAEIVASLHLLSRTSGFAGRPRGRCKMGNPAPTISFRTRRRVRLRLVAALLEPTCRSFGALSQDQAAEHAAIMDAAVGRDIARANVLMDAHLLATEQAVARFLHPTANDVKRKIG